MSTKFIQSDLMDLFNTHDRMTFHQACAEVNFPKWPGNAVAMYVRGDINCAIDEGWDQDINSVY